MLRRFLQAKWLKIQSVTILDFFPPSPLDYFSIYHFCSLEQIQSSIRQVRVHNEILSMRVEVDTQITQVSLTIITHITFPFVRATQQISLGILVTVNSLILSLLKPNKLQQLQISFYLLYAPLKTLVAQCIQFIWVFKTSQTNKPNQIGCVAEKKNKEITCQTTLRQSCLID